VKTTTMTLTRRRQGEGGLLIRPVKPLTKAEVAKLLSQPPAGPHSAEEAVAIVERAMREVRRG
jgi:hypothetical protein